MADDSYHVFTLAVDTRAPLLASSGTRARRRADLEREWARRRGIAGEVLRADSMTDSMSPFTSHSPSWVGTETENGTDIHSDQTDDEETSQVSDDLQNDAIV